MIAYRLVAWQRHVKVCRDGRLKSYLRICAPRWRSEVVPLLTGSLGYALAPAD
jgi:hypothetical protein